MSRFSLCTLASPAARLRRRLGLLTRAERAWPARIEAAIATLPEPTGSVFRLMRHRDLDYAKAGAELGLSERDVEAHMAKALRILAGVPGVRRPP